MKLQKAAGAVSALYNKWACSRGVSRSELGHAHMDSTLSCSWSVCHRPHVPFVFKSKITNYNSQRGRDCALFLLFFLHILWFNYLILSTFFLREMAMMHENARFMCMTKETFYCQLFYYLLQSSRQNGYLRLDVADIPFPDKILIASFLIIGLKKEAWCNQLVPQIWYWYLSFISFCGDVLKEWIRNVLL